jgi:hypothetical protein
LARRQVYDDRLTVGVAASSVGYLSSLMRIMAWRGIPASHDASPTSSTSSDRPPPASRRGARQIPVFFSSYARGPLPPSPLALGWSAQFIGER